jgi:hypothetical protein
MEARTIHRLLEVDPKAGGFRRGPDHPLDCDLLVVDETSMVDILLMHALAPCSTASSTTPTASTSPERACGEPVNPATRPEPVALWTCRCAWTTLERCPHAHSSRRRKPSSRDSRLTTRLHRCQKPTGQNASRPGDIKSVYPGEIIGIHSQDARGCASWRGSTPSRTRIGGHAAPQGARLTARGRAHLCGLWIASGPLTPRTTRGLHRGIHASPLAHSGEPETLFFRGFRELKLAERV